MHEGPTVILSTSLMNYEQSRIDATNQGVSTSMPCLPSENMFASQISQWSEYTLPTSRMMKPMNDPSPPTAERFYLPTMPRDENTATMSHENDSPLFSERLSCGMSLTRLDEDVSASLDTAYLPITVVVPRRTEMYMASTALRNDGLSSSEMSSTPWTSQGTYVQTPNSSAGGRSSSRNAVNSTSFFRAHLYWHNGILQPRLIIDYQPIVVGVSY